MRLTTSEFLDRSLVERWFRQQRQNLFTEHDISSLLASLISETLGDEGEGQVHLEFPLSVFHNREPSDGRKRIDIAVLSPSLTEKIKSIGWIRWSEQQNCGRPCNLFVEVKNFLIPTGSPKAKSYPNYSVRGVEQDLE